MPGAISHHSALIYVMVMMSAVDRKMSDRELGRIGAITRNLPIFEDFDQDRLLSVAQECADILDDDEGLETVLGLIAGGLQSELYETAYALGVEVAASDLNVRPEEEKLLQMLRSRLGLDRLTTVAIERAARARHLRLEPGWC